MDFDQVYREMRGRVFALGLRMAGDAAAAEDVVQETFLLVHRFQSRFRGEARLSTWIWRIALRVAGKERRRRHSRPVESLDSGAAQVAASPPRAPVPVEGDETEGILRALDRLPEDQRTVLTLMAIDGIPTKEIAEVLGVPEGTVWSRAHAARKRLLSLLREPVVGRA